MGRIHRVFHSVFISACLIGMVGGTDAAGKERDIHDYLKLISEADVAHLGGAIIAERQPSYEVRWNSSTLVPVEGKSNIYAERRLIGGTNRSKGRLNIIALIPMGELRDKQHPSEQIETVTVNGKPEAIYRLLLPGQEVDGAIEVARSRFSQNRHEFEQLDLRAPLLFINAGTIEPGSDVHIEYALKPRPMVLN